MSRQREIVAGTFNWQRDSATTNAAPAQRRTSPRSPSRRDVCERMSSTLVGQLRERGVSASDTMFAKIQVELTAAAAAMKEAEETLGRGRGGEALPPEQKALQHAQRARGALPRCAGADGPAAGRRWRRRWWSEQNAEDLADLFELQTDKLRNQYEAVQQSSQQAAQQEVDETLERLKQLASRQQQENERLQRMAAGALRATRRNRRRAAAVVAAAARDWRDRPRKKRAVSSVCRVSKTHRSSPTRRSACSRRRTRCVVPHRAQRRRAAQRSKNSIVRRASWSSREATVRTMASSNSPTRRANSRSASSRLREGVQRPAEHATGARRADSPAG